MPPQHPDDEFHRPPSDDPYWTETCWFTFTVPERKLSGRFYLFFRPNQGVLASAAYFWDEIGMSAADHDLRTPTLAPAYSGPTAL